MARNLVDISKWRSSSWLICPALDTQMRMYFAKHNLTVMKLFNSFILALIKGDISVNVQPTGENRLFIGVSATLDSVFDIVFMDSKGNVLKTDNPNIIEGGLI